MNKHIKQFIIVFAVIFSFPFFGHSQDGIMVSTQDSGVIKMFDENNYYSAFKIKGNPKFEMRNGVLSISLTSHKNTLLQINGIREKYIKDTVLKDNVFRVVYIISQTEKPFISNETNSKSILTVKCKSTKPGSPIAIIIKGKIFNERKYYNIEGRFTGKIPEQKFTKTDIKN